MRNARNIRLQPGPHRDTAFAKFVIKLEDEAGAASMLGGEAPRARRGVGAVWLPGLPIRRRHENFNHD